MGNNVSHRMEKTEDAKRRPLLIRVVLVAIGTVLVLGGLVGLLLPIVPGWLLIIAGLAILATEFVWARRLLDSAKTKATELKAKVPSRRHDAA